MLRLEPVTKAMWHVISHMVNVPSCQITMLLINISLCIIYLLTTTTTINVPSVINKVLSVSLLTSYRARKKKACSQQLHHITQI